MKRLYTLQQYDAYSKLMDRMANCDDIGDGASIHMKIHYWIMENHISQMAVEQMDTVMEQEFEDEKNNIKKEGKIVDFPKRQ